MINNKLRPTRILQGKDKFFIIKNGKLIELNKSEFEIIKKLGYLTNKVIPKITKNKVVKTFSKRVKNADKTNNIKEIQTQLTTLYNKLITEPENKKRNEEIERIRKEQEETRKFIEQQLKTTNEILTGKIKQLPPSENINLVQSEEIKPEEIQKILYSEKGLQTENINEENKTSFITEKDLKNMIKKLDASQKMNLYNNITKNNFSQSKIIESLNLKTKDDEKTLTNPLGATVNKNEFNKYIFDNFNIKDISDAYINVVGKGLESQGKGIAIYQVEEVLQGLPYFLGVLTLDSINTKLQEVKKFQTPIFSFIFFYENYLNNKINHYTSVFCDLVNYKEICYYDSYGNNIQPKLYEILKNFIDGLKLPYMLKYKENHIKNQSETSDTCSLFAMFYIYQRYFGFSHKEATNFTNIEENEKRMYYAKVNFGFV
jgi:hypothetical protein